VGPRAVLNAVVKRKMSIEVFTNYSCVTNDIYRYESTYSPHTLWCDTATENQRPSNYWHFKLTICNILHSEFKYNMNT